MLRKDFILRKTRNLLNEFMALITANADKPGQKFLRQVGVIWCGEQRRRVEGEAISNISSPEFIRRFCRTIPNTHVEDPTRRDAIPKTTGAYANYQHRPRTSNLYVIPAQAGIHLAAALIIQATASRHASYSQAQQSP